MIEFQNMRKRSDIQLISKEAQHKFRISKPNFKRFKIFEEDLVGVEMLPTKVKLDKPLYVGASILDLSKNLMYGFWYDTLKPKYNNIQLCFTGKYYVKLYFQTSEIIPFIINVNRWSYSALSNLKPPLLQTQIASYSLWRRRTFTRTWVKCDLNITIPLITLLITPCFRCRTSLSLATLR